MIQRGGVRVDLNTNLCYVRTVNWSYILGNQTAAAAPIRLLTNRLICPDTCQPECVASTPESRSLTEPKGTSREKDAKLGHCWSSSYCQSSKFRFLSHLLFDSNYSLQGICSLLFGPFN